MKQISFARFFVLLAIGLVLLLLAGPSGQGMVGFGAAACLSLAIIIVVCEIFMLDGDE